LLFRGSDYIAHLEEQNEWHPLVVADELSVLGDVKPFFRDSLFNGQVVCVADPADGVRIVAVTVGELRRTPAVDRLVVVPVQLLQPVALQRVLLQGVTSAVDRPPDKLFGADEKAEADEDDDGVLTTQAVDVVIVHTKLQFANAQH